MIRFQRETLAEMAGEIGPLWWEHYQDRADANTPPFEPDWERYILLDIAGNLFCLTARDEQGEMVGYLLAIIDTHLHFRSTKFANVDIYWLRPAHRGGRTALRMLAETERLFAEAGVKVILQHTWLSLDQSRLLSHLGYTPTESVMTKVL